MFDSVSFVSTPNQIVHDPANEDFYVSHLRSSVDYGCETTAVVVGQMERFYILCGDHRQGLSGKSFNECLDYLHDHIDERHTSASEFFPPRGSTIEIILYNPCQYTKTEWCVSIQ